MTSHHNPANTHPKCQALCLYNRTLFLLTFYIQISNSAEVNFNLLFFFWREGALLVLICFPSLIIFWLIRSIRLNRLIQPLLLTKPSSIQTCTLIIIIQCPASTLDIGLNSLTGSSNVEDHTKPCLPLLCAFLQLNTHPGTDHFTKVVPGGFYAALPQGRLPRDPENRRGCSKEG